MEVLEQSEKLFKSEKHFYAPETFNTLVERLKELLSRLTRLDAFVSASMSENGQIQMANLYPQKIPLNQNSAYSFLRRALPTIS